MPFETVKKWCDDNNMPYIEASAKTGSNIKKIFETITASLYESTSNINNNYKDGTVILDQSVERVANEKKGKCCKN